VSLIIVLVQSVQPPASGVIAALGLLALAYSFAADTRRLWMQANRGRPEGLHFTSPREREGPHDEIPQQQQRWAWRAAATLVALFFLNLTVTFRNVWPSPAIKWRGDVSIELAVCLLAVAASGIRRVQAGTTRLRCLSGLWMLLIVGRYAEVTAPALYGRDINLYWDLRFIPDVARMVVRVAPVWLIVVTVAGTAAALLLFYTLVSLAWQTVARAAGDRRTQRVLISASAAIVLIWTGRLVTGRSLAEPPFADPVALTYARQVRLMAESLSGSTTIGASPAMNSDLSRVLGADVLLIFVESYGAASFERRDVADRLETARRQLETAVATTGREAVSVYVESPTFGGSSWLAHITLMSGVEVRDQWTNSVLMTERRNTLVRAFAQHGFRTVALMPGLRKSWPEGAFYGFDEIYGAARLAYRGPEFGWFSIPDQYSLERLDQLEISRTPRGRLFLFFPTLSTHFPFNPTPPYQPDWTRVASEHPFDGPAIVRAYAQQPDWMNFTPGYAGALSYEMTMFAGYLQKHRDDDMVMILVGDHQPPALVSGQRASWDVPVHVIARQRSILDRLIARGFRRGLRPERPALGRMQALLPILLQSFGDPE
jgi:Sulfatase